jgi:hypothetical protein
MRMLYPAGGALLAQQSAHIGHDINGIGLNFGLGWERPV